MTEIPKRPKKAKTVPKGSGRAVKPVEPVPGYRGFIALALSSGQVTSIKAQAVHRHDRFDYAYGLNERLEHVPAEGDRGDVTHFYAYARLKDGGHCFEVLSRAEMDALRDRSESYQAYRAGRTGDSAWVTGYAEMGKETVLRRIAEYLPLDMQNAVSLADLPRAEDLPQVPASQDQGPEPQAVSLTEEELAGLFPPGYVIRILDAAAEHGMPDEVLAEIAGAPVDEIPPEDESAILRAIASWQP